MNVYTYGLHDAISNKKLVSGTIHTPTIELAARAAIRLCKLTIEQRVNKYYTDTDFMRDGRKVYLHVGVPAEYFLDATTVTRREVGPE